MSITNFIDNDDITLVQGVNGICLCEESWIKREAGRQPAECVENTLDGGAERRLSTSKEE